MHFNTVPLCHGEISICLLDGVDRLSHSFPKSCGCRGEGDTPVLESVRPGQVSQLLRRVVNLAKDVRKEHSTRGVGGASVRGESIRGLLVGSV